MLVGKLLVGSFAVALAVFLFRDHLATGQVPAQEPGRAKTSTFMRLKLEPAKSALEGIALADFEMIAKSASAIRNLMLDESWMVVQSEEYRRQSGEFGTIVKQLEKAAHEKNVDRATLAYVQMTIRCVQCHELLRK